MTLEELCNGLFFFEICSVTCTYKLARYENLFAHIVAVMRLHLSKKNNPLLKYILCFGDGINETGFLKYFYEINTKRLK